jgi:hypothetical protein
MLIIFVRIMFALAVASNGLAQSLTLRELARLNTPQPVHAERTRDAVIVPLADVVKSADLIVYGTVTASATYLSAGEHELYTDYTLSPIRVLADARPRTIQTLIVKRWGGHIVLDGVDVYVEDRNLRPFVDGETLILFLQQGEESKYRIVGEVSGAVSVSDGRVVEKPESMLKVDDAANLTVAEFEAHIIQVR